MTQNVFLAVGIIYLIAVISGYNAEPSLSTSCGCCPSPWCTTKSIPCSSNGDCECLLMTMTGGGMCADTVISCSHLTRCLNDNVTCIEPNTICVNNTRCNEPVCYPIERASSNSCPPMTSRYSSPTPPVETTSLAISTTLSSSTTSPTTTTESTTESTTTETLSTTTLSTTTTESTTVPTTTETSSTTTFPTTTTESTTVSTTTETSSTTTKTTTTTTVNACLNGTQCLNNGTCQPSGTSFFCLCPSTHHGLRCELYGGTDFSILEGIINGSIVNYDKTVENVLNRTNWSNILAVIDVTGSMQPCAAAVYKWMKLAYEKLNLIKYYTFFNDGDNKITSEKVIGSTGGIYGIETTDLYTVLATMETAMKNGYGGDGPENDIEALLYGIRHCPSCSNVILIADNQVTPRDMILLPNVTMPVKVITCQLGSTPVNPNLLNIAAKTNGSLHTLEEDIVTLSGIPIGGTIIIGTRTYRRTATGYVLA